MPSMILERKKKSHTKILKNNQTNKKESNYGVIEIHALYALISHLFDPCTRWPLHQMTSPAPYWVAGMRSEVVTM